MNFFSEINYLKISLFALDFYELRLDYALFII